MRLCSVLLLVAVWCAYTAAKSLSRDREDGQDSWQERGLVPYRLDGVDLTSLTSRDLTSLLEAEDEKLKGELDIWSGKRQLAKGKGKKGIRWFAAARGLFQAGRALFRGATRLGKPNIGKTRTVINYGKQGTYRNARKDFNRLKPQNRQPLPPTSKYKGYTGQVGNHKVTVRTGSKGKPGQKGHPTLEILSKKQNGREVLRKFRYTGGKKP